MADERSLAAEGRGGYLPIRSRTCGARRCDMRRRSSLRAVFAALGLLSPLLSGCLPLGYAYPSVEHVWEVPVGPVASEVRAFRVDVADEQNCIDIPEDDRYLLGAISLTPEGSVPAQTQMAFDHGW